MAREIYVDCFIGDKKRPKTQLKTNIDFLVEPTSGVYFHVFQIGILSRL